MLVFNLIRSDSSPLLQVYTDSSQVRLLGLQPKNHTGWPIEAPIIQPKSYTGWTGLFSGRIQFIFIISLFSRKRGCTNANSSQELIPNLRFFSLGFEPFVRLLQSESMAAEEESIEQAASARRERLRALRAAQELSATPDDAPDPNGNGWVFLFTQ